MVPPGLLAQLGYDLVHPLGGVDVATPHYACGAEAQKLQGQGYQMFATKAQAQSGAAAVNKQTSPTSPGNPLSGLAAIGDFFGRLGQANTWIRIGEVALGLLLVAIGVAKMTNVVPIATKIAGVIK
jgi:hypothetical protein